MQPISVLSFSTLLYLGGQIYQQAPPIPNAVQIKNGDIVYNKQDIEDGQNIWQTIGGMQQGSIWGHGGYLAPDWSADWLHREALALLDVLKSGKQYRHFLSALHLVLAVLADKSAHQDITK
jgi:nitric oxide reductase subunit B